jgi:hypothetical protein
VTDDAGERAEAEQLRKAAKRVLEADMLGVRDLDALNALEDAAGFSQQGQRRAAHPEAERAPRRVCDCPRCGRGPCQQEQGPCDRYPDAVADRAPGEVETVARAFGYRPMPPHLKGAPGEQWEAGLGMAEAAIADLDAARGRSHEDTVTLAEVREQAARVYYRWMMGDDYESFPWDDENEPSNETKREAEQFAADLLARFGAARAEEGE